MDLDSASASGVSASYTGVDGMGLIWSLRPSAKDIAAGRLFYEARGTTRSFTLEARVHGHRVGKTSFGRADTAAPLRQRKLTFSSSGLSGTFVWSPTQRGRHPAVLLFGGSGGGPPDSLTAMAQLVLAAAPPTFLLAGHSMGGRVALEKRLPRKAGAAGIPSLARALETFGIGQSEIRA